MKYSLALTTVTVLVMATNSATAADGNNMPLPVDTAATAKPHSHMTEKSGMPASRVKVVPVAADEKSSASKDKSKHFHPRDGK